MNNEEKEQLIKIKDIIELNMKITCGLDCSKGNCGSCSNKEILDIVNKLIKD
mgnify:CR=1 FL=1